MLSPERLAVHDGEHHERFRDKIAANKHLSLHHGQLLHLPLGNDLVGHLVARQHGSHELRVAYLVGENVLLLVVRDVVAREERRGLAETLDYQCPLRKSSLPVILFLAIILPFSSETTSSTNRKWSL